MQNKSLEEIAEIIIDKLIDNLGNRLKDFGIEIISDDNVSREFSINFVAYDYFVIRISFDKGRIGTCIDSTLMIDLNLKTKWWENIDLNKYANELKEELELRIPDKYLKAKGWL